MVKIKSIHPAMGYAQNPIDDCFSATRKISEVKNCTIEITNLHPESDVFYRYIVFKLKSIDGKYLKINKLEYKKNVKFVINFDVKNGMVYYGLLCILRHSIYTDFIDYFNAIVEKDKKRNKFHIMSFVETFTGNGYKFLYGTLFNYIFTYQFKFVDFEDYFEFLNSTVTTSLNNSIQRKFFANGINKFLEEDQKIEINKLLIVTYTKDQYYSIFKLLSKYNKTY